MNIIRDGLTGAEITGINKIHDYWQIITNKGGINIYNPFGYYTCGNIHREMLDLQLRDIIGQIITDVEYEKEDHLSFKLNNGGTIFISIDKKDYLGPEAFDIHLDTGEIIAE